MKDIRNYTLTDVLEDIKNMEDESKCNIDPVYDYLHIIVLMMKQHYEKKEFDNEIIKESQSRDIAVETYLVESYHSTFKN